MPSIFTFTDKETTQDMLCDIPVLDPVDRSKRCLSYLYALKPGSESRSVMVKFNEFYNAHESVEYIFYINETEIKDVRFNVSSSPSFAKLLKRNPDFFGPCSQPSPHMDKVLIERTIHEQLGKYLLPSVDTMHLVNIQVFHNDGTVPMDLSRAIFRLPAINIHWIDLPMALTRVAKLELSEPFYRGYTRGGIWSRFYDP